MVEWLKNKLKSLSEDELCNLYSEIADYRKKGFLAAETKLELLEKDFSIHMSKTSGDNIRLIEDAVLFEIGSRYFNLITYNSGKLPKHNDDIWYTDFDNGILEHGKVVTVTFQDGKFDTFSIDFDDGTFDVFDSSGFNKHFFINKARAEAELIKGMCG